MKATLYDYQKNIVDEIIKKGDPSVALFMDMGTGKTLTSLGLFEEYVKLGYVDKLLVVCLKNKIQDWKDEIKEQWCDFTNYEVINFESIWRAKRAEYFKNFVDERTFIIIDESQKIKDYKSKVSQFLISIKNQTRYKVLLTGTPQNQQYIDYYPQLKFLDSKIYDIDHKTFMNRYVLQVLDSARGRYFYKIAGYAHVGDLKQGIIEKAYYHTYTSDYDAPREIYENIEHSKDSIKFQKDKVWIDPEGIKPDVLGDTEMSLRIYMRQSCSGFIRDIPIANPKLEWLENFLEINPERVVIFTNFVTEIEMISKLCEKLKRPYGVYYGAKKDLQGFKNNENGVAIVNYQSGATGINDLCIAHYGIFYSPTEDYILFAQAKARLDRIGQTKQPVFYYLVTKGSVESAIYRSLKRGESFDASIFCSWLEENNNGIRKSD